MKSVSQCQCRPIVGGVKVNISEIPFQVLLRHGNNSFCGGALYSKNYVLTAAHCLDYKAIASIKVRIGSSKRNKGGVLVNLIKAYIHKNFFHKRPDYDICILKLADYKYAKDIEYVKLPNQNEIIADNTIVRVSGWGKTLETPESRTYLRAVEVKIINQNVCKNAYENLSPRMLCAGYLNGGKDACVGDSGGPLTLNNKLIGIVSFGTGCALPNYPGVYVRVASFRNWIRTTIGN